MKERRFRLIRRYDDYDPVVLGVVIIPRGRGMNQTIRSIKAHWVNFQIEHSDEDSAFLAYLRKKGFEIESKRDQCIEVVLD